MASNIVVYQLPVLPDLLLDHTLLGDGPDRRLGEYLNRWTQLVAGLWVDPSLDLTVSLRFSSNPTSGQTTLSLVIQSEQALQTELLAGHVHRLLGTMGLQLKRDGDSIPHGWPTSAGGLFELRQYEQIVNTQLDASTGHTGDEYFINAYDRPVGTFLAPFDSLAIQPVPVTVVITLRPRWLLEPERRYLTDLANRGRRLAHKPNQAIYGAQAFAGADAMAEWLPELVLPPLRRLIVGLPFLLAVHIGSADVSAARAVAMAIAASINESDSGESGDSGPSQRAQVIAIPQTEWAEAHQTISQGRFWASQASTDDKLAKLGRTPITRRLRYLTDARGAASVFRLPISVRGGIPGIEVRQSPPAFDPGPRPPWKPQDASTPDAERRIAIGRLPSGGIASIPLKELAKHALITGFTGGGKSNTVRILLDQLWRFHRVPFLVLESAKNEYRGFLGMPEFKNDAKPLRVYTLGNENCAPFRLNPFELLPGVRLEAHLGRLQNCFEAVMPSEGPLPSLVNDALLGVYEEKRWRLTNAGGDPGTEHLRFPVMRDFERVILQLLDKKTPANPRGRGYVGETLYNLQGFVRSRISPLLAGSKGLMFSQERSIPAKELFEAPVVLEMNDLNQTDKSIITLFVLTLLREYRERNPAKTRPLEHVTVVEEAHNVLENVGQAGEGQSNARFMAVQSFCNMLAEVRAYGEGLIIADQSPEKLAPDALRNTNLQIAHNLRHADDRDTVARAMVMTDEQRDFIGKLGVGHTAVFYTGLDRATFVKIPRYDKADAADEPRLTGRGVQFSNAIDDDTVSKHMAKYTTSYMMGPFGPACKPCRDKATCPHRPKMLKIIPDKVIQDAGKLWEGVDASKTQSLGSFLAKLENKAIELVTVPNTPADPQVIWCGMVHLWGQPAADTPFNAQAVYNMLELRVKTGSN